MPQRVITALALAALIAACGKMTPREEPGAGAVIYPSTILTMEEARPSATAVAVEDGEILAVGDIDDLVETYTGAEIDETFARMTLMPGLIDVSAETIGEAPPPADGVTSAAALYRGESDDAAIAARWASPDRSGYRLYLVAAAPATGAAGAGSAPAPVLPFLRLPPAPCGGGGDDAPLTEAIAGARRAALGPRLRADDEAARGRVFAALESLGDAPGEEASGGRAIIESAGRIGAGEIERAGALGAAIILRGDPPLAGCAPPIAIDDEDKVDAAAEAVSASVVNAAPLPAGRIALSPGADRSFPLRAAGARLGAGEGERLSPREALEAVTIDAAFALGLESEIGSIAAGKRADFLALERNPFATAGEDWGAIVIRGVVLGGEKRPSDSE